MNKKYRFKVKRSWSDKDWIVIDSEYLNCFGTEYIMDWFKTRQQARWYAKKWNDFSKYIEDERELI